ncbi:ice-binding family protein, partial [Pontibacter toksunensis]
MIRALLLTYFFMTVGISLSLAQSDPSLGQASSFVVLAKTQIINNGETGLMGNVGVSPAGSISGEELIDLTGGRFEVNTAASASALEDANTAYNHLSALAPDEILPLPIIGGRSLTPGTYRIGGNATLKGTLTLDGLDQSNALFVIQIDGSLYSDPISSNIRLINGAQAKNVFWVMTGGVELQSNTLFQGTMLAKGDIILHTSVNGAGRAISLEGKVVLNANNVVVPSDVLPDLSISKTAPDKSYQVSDRITYTIVIRNTGVGTAFGVKVTENFPAALRYVPGSAVYTEGEFNESNFTWELSFLQFGESREIQLTFDIISAGETANSVTVESNERDLNPEDNNDDVTIDVPLPPANMSVEKVALPGPYAVGGRVSYTVTARNAGPGAAEGVVVTENIPDGLTLVSAVTLKGTYDQSANKW